MTGYNPGLVVSVLLNIPIGVYAVAYLSSHGLVSTTANVVSLLIGIAIQAVVMFWGFVILKPRVPAAANARGEVSGRPRTTSTRGTRRHSLALGSAARAVG